MSFEEETLPFYKERIPLLFQRFRDFYTWVFSFTNTSEKINYLLTKDLNEIFERSYYQLDSIKSHEEIMKFVKDVHNEMFEKANSKLPSPPTNQN